jgi:disulfide bond formation protein DsbB
MLKLLYNLNTKKAVLLITSIVGIALLISYFVESYFGIKPCILCLYQRYIYILLLLVTCFSIFQKTDHRKFHYIILLMSLILLLGQSMVALYNIGVENKMFSGLASCHITTPTYSSLEELSSHIKSKQNLSSCDEPAFQFYNITFAKLNFCVAALLFIFGLIKLLYEAQNFNKDKK